MDENRLRVLLAKIDACRTKLKDIYTLRKFSNSGAVVSGYNPDEGVVTIEISSLSIYTEFLKVEERETKQELEELLKELSEL